MLPWSCAQTYINQHTVCRSDAGHLFHMYACHLCCSTCLSRKHKSHYHAANNIIVIIIVIIMYIVIITSEMVIMRIVVMTWCLNSQYLLATNNPEVFRFHLVLFKGSTEKLENVGKCRSMFGKCLANCGVKQRIVGNYIQRNYWKRNK